MLRKALFVVVTVLLVACGGGGSASGGSRTVEVVMRDNDFSVASLQVNTGETVTFVFHNQGQAVHEAYIGDEQAQTLHEQAMMAGTASAHADPNEIVVQPGQTGTLVHTFATAGPTVVGCHETGHYASGMRMVVNVG
jgi:uncharacterized cupredoxin-like copper-binding protein